MRYRLAAAVCLLLTLGCHESPPAAPSQPATQALVQEATEAPKSAETTEFVLVNGEWHPVHAPAPIFAVRATDTGKRVLWPITGGPQGPPYGVEFLHPPLPGQGNVEGRIHVWWDGRNYSIYLHSTNAHEWQPVWHGHNFLQVKLVDSVDD
jgi:hypothetical protein